MPAATAQEQLFLEFINEVRLDPLRNASRYVTAYAPLTSSEGQIQVAIDYFAVSGSALLAAYQALTPAAPLAWNDALAAAADKHSAALIAADAQSHQLPGEPSLSARVLAEGYSFARVGENVFSYAEGVLHGHAGFMIDWGDGPTGMQSPPGHRNNIMNAAYSEIGIDATAEANLATRVGPLVVTQDFGDRGLTFVLGVAYADIDGDRFYSLGEGRGDLTVQAGTAAATSVASGGYALAVAAGQQVFTFSGGGLAAPVDVAAAIGGDNIKLDIVNGTTLLTSASVAVTGPIAEIRGLGTQGLTLTAGGGSQHITGTGGSDVLNGGEGYDTAVYSGVREAYRLTVLGDGRFALSSDESGYDVLSGIEAVRFADGTFRWHAETGELVRPSITGALRLFAATGFVGEVGGGAAIFGTIGFQDITVHAGTAAEFDPSFNRGGDIVRIAGAAADLSAAIAGSQIVLTGPSLSVTIPVGSAGVAIVFDDGMRTLRADTGSGAVKLGHQVLSASASAITAPPESTGLPAGGDSAATASGFLAADAEVSIGGNVALYGTTGAEIVTYLRGDLVLDPSFNRGGDTLILPETAGAYEARLTGSSAVLESPGGTIIVPVGTPGMLLDFAGEHLLLRYDLATQTVRLGETALGDNFAAFA